MAAAHLLFSSSMRTHTKNASNSNTVTFDFILISSFFYRWSPNERVWCLTLFLSHLIFFKGISFVVFTDLRYCESLSPDKKKWVMIRVWNYFYSKWFIAAIRSDCFWHKRPSLSAALRAHTQTHFHVPKQALGMRNLCDLHYQRIVR